MADPRRLADLPDQARTARRVWPYLRPHRALIGVAVAVNLLATLALTVVPAAVGAAVDRLLERDRTGLLIFAGVVVALVVARLILLRAAEILLTRAGERVVRGLRNLAVERLAKAPLRFVEAHRSGDLLQRSTVEIAELAAFVRGQLPDLLSVVGYLVFSAAMLMLYSWQLLLLVLLVFIPPMWFVSRRFKRAAGEAYPAEAAARSTVVSTFAEGIDAREQLQLAGATGWWTARLGRDNATYHRAVRRTQRALVWLESAWLVQGLASAVLLLVGGLLVADGRLTVGAVVVFVLATRDLYSAADDLTFVVGELVETRVGLARLMDLLDATCPAPPATGSAAGPGDLVADDLTFGYGPDATVLDGVSLSVRAGERVGLVGETGAGKSTLAKILCGLYEPDGGVVRYGGTALADLAPEALRRHLVLVPQQVHLVDGTLAENLALTPGRPGPDDYRRAVGQLRLGDWVDSLPRGLDTDVGPRGQHLSAGERQLVGLLRAALIDPDVLILDEATADIDPVTAERVETALAHLHQGRTLIVIAHRPTTIARLPRVVTLTAGRLTCPR